MIESLFVCFFSNVLINEVFDPIYLLSNNYCVAQLLFCIIEECKINRVVWVYC